MSKLTEAYVKRYILACRDEAATAKITRMEMNRDNYDMYHLKHDFSHKKEGQSQEVLSKQRMAVEQIKSFFQQALVDLGEWWRAVTKDGSDGAGMLVRPEEIQKLTNYMLKKANYYSHVGKSVQSALLGALSITKVHGCLVPKPKYTVKTEGRGKSYKKTVVKTEDKTWELKLDVIRQENYYPDPQGNKLYEVEECYADFHEVLAYAKGDYAIYDLAEVKKADIYSGTKGDGQAEWRKAKEQGQDEPAPGMRPRVKITNFQGNIIDDETGEMLAENVVATLMNEDIVIRMPTPNPHWHQRSDIVASPLIEVANSVWHTALMDAATQHNRALIEMFNLVLDSGMMAVHGIKQLRTDVMIDPKQAANGLKAGDTIQVSSALPHGMKALETVVTGEIPSDALNVMNILNQEFNASALTNDLRQGVMPFRSVKATEVVEASNTITSVFQGVAKNVEASQIHPELELSWMTTAQNWDLIDKEVFVSLFGRERGEELSQLSPQDVFVSTVNGIRFEVFGISLTLGKTADFRKLTTLLQTIGASEVLIEEFVKKYDFGKLLGEIMVALDLDKKKLEVSGTQTGPALQGGAEEPPQEVPPGGAPDQMSQVPQAGGGSLADVLGQQSFPGSPALAGQGG